MKKQFCTILAIALTVSQLAGCQSTPGSKAVPEAHTAAQAQTAATLEVPDRFTGSWTGVEGCVSVQADATVTVPEGAAFPTAAIERRFFSQEEADTLRQIFTGDSPFYQEVNLTKQKARERLEEYYAMQRGEIPLALDGDRTMEDLPEVIARWEGYLEEAPEEGEFTPADTQFQPDPDGTRGESITGWSEVNGSKIHIHVFNDSESFIASNAIVYREGYGDTNGGFTVPAGEFPEEVAPVPAPAMTEAEAIAMGDDLMDRLGQTDVVCGQITPVVFSSGRDAVYYNDSENTVLESGYEMQYVRCVNGLPIGYTPFLGSAVPESSDLNTWVYETITVSVTADGVVYFRWMSPSTQPVVLNESTPLLPFEDIQDIFGKMILVKNEDLISQNIANGFECHRNIDVYDVRLTLMRVRDKDSLTEGTIVPVWDFYGIDSLRAVEEEYREYVYEGGHDTIVLTINAIDGTIIDRELGY